MNSHQEVLHGNSSVDYSVKARKGYQFSSFTQSCPTLCNPMDCSPPGSPVPGILQARTLEWVAISFSIAYSLEGKLDQPRQHIKKQRHYFADKRPSSQSYGFSSNRVWI